MLCPRGSGVSKRCVDLRHAGVPMVRYVVVNHSAYPNRNEGRLKFNLPYVDSGMFYHDFGRLNFNLPTPSYKLIKSHLFYLAYVMYCFYVRAAYSTFWGRPARYRVHFFELQERPLVATKLAGNGRLNFNLPSLNVIHRRDVVDLNSIYHFRLGYSLC